MCFAGHKIFGGDAYAAETKRIRNAEAIWRIFCSKFYVILLWYRFSLKFGKEDHKIKKRFHRRILGYLITFPRSVLLFYRKAFVVACFWAKVCWSSCASKEANYRLEDTSSDLGAQPEMPPSFPPCIGVARSFNWGAPNQKSHAMTSSEIFEGRTFCGTKILYNGRSKAVAQFGV